MSEFVRVARASDITSGKSKVIELNGRPVVVFNQNGKFSAIDNICPHKGAPLNEGVFMGTMIVCPWHSWTFDINSGSCITNPRAKVSCFEVKIENDELFLKVQ
ncbi:MAG: Rieske (2Fe-2S) protein [Acidobacteria bacterium]|nr:Rieske (2Fe-2S) protein [Acidobacteriota bacterium]